MLSLHIIEELCKVLSPEMKGKLNSGFFLPGYEKLLHLLYVDSETLRSLLSTSEGAEQVCLVLPPEKGKQLHSDLPFKAKKGLLFKFFGDEQELVVTFLQVLQIVVVIQDRLHKNRLVILEVIKMN